MSVTNGQDANANNFNNAFMSRTVDTDTNGRMTLKNTLPESGPQINNVQKNINALFSLIGLAANQAKDALITWADGTSTSLVDKVNQLIGVIQKKYDLQNNISSFADIDGLLLDSTKEKSADLKMEIERVGSVEYRQVINVVCIFKNSNWSLFLNGYNGDDIAQSDAIAESYNVQLSILPSGQIQYKSGNISGHTKSTIRLYEVRFKL